MVFYPNQTLEFALENFNDFINASFPVIEQQQLKEEVGDKVFPEISLKKFLAVEEPMPMSHLIGSINLYREYVEEWEVIIADLKE
jgi:hypothetical protein